MRDSDFKLLEEYMKEAMKDGAHDTEHIYRVLYLAMDIAETESKVDYDVLIAACLLHDVGRQEQFENPRLCHAEVGAEKAYYFLLEHDFTEKFSARVRECIRKHRFRSDNPPVAIEEKILFDADKIEAAGAVGIARTLLYAGEMGENLYSVDADGEISDGTGDEVDSFFCEYKHKLEKIYSGFLTRRGKEISRERKQAAVSFYESMLREVKDSRQLGKRLLRERMENEGD